MTKADKIKERKAALLAKLKQLEKEESAVVSAEKQARRKEDTRTKTLLGIATMMSLKESLSAVMLASIARSADKMTPTDRKFLAGSRLWKELGLSMPRQDAVQPQEAGTTAPVENPAAVTAQPGVTPSATSRTSAGRVAQEKTPLTKADFYAKDAVKALGAIFDVAKKMWFVPAGMDLTPFEKWL